MATKESVSSETLTKQNDLHQQAGKILEENAKVIEHQNSLLSKQAALLAEVSRAFKDIMCDGDTQGTQQGCSEAFQKTAKAMSELIDKSKELSSLNGNVKQGQAGVAAATNEAAEKSEKLNKALKGTNKSMQDNAKKAGVLSKTMKVLGKGFGLLKGLAKGILGVFGTLLELTVHMIGTMAKLGLAIFAFPFKLLAGLIEMSQQGGGGNPLAEAMEEVREALGDLSSGPAKDVIDGFNDIRQSAQDLGGTGVSLRQVFGMGPEGLAAALKDVLEFATAAGESMSRLIGDIRKSPGHLMAYNRGLGISKEELMSMADVAKSRGQDVDAAMEDFSKTAIVNAKKFGLGIKDMAKGMTALSTDVANFGHLGPKAFAPITAYARKLGLEIKDMAGVMDKFAGFEETTESAAKMSQAFGMNVDSMKLMAAQDPAEKIEVMRKSFFATGQDIKNMNYQQRKYLASLTGLEGKSLEAAFSLNQQGISYENIAKQSEDANKQQMSTEQVMKELGKQMKRLIQTMSGPEVKGFFDAFIKGFEMGIMRSKPFRAVMRNLARSLRIVRQAGIQVGKAFVQYFPGVNKFLGGLKDFFDPKSFKNLSRKLVKVFTDLFKDMRSDPKAGVKKFFEEMKKLFKDFFSSKSPAIEAIKDGAKSFGKALVVLISESIKYIKPMIVSGIKSITEFIAHPQEFLQNMKDAGSFVYELFEPLIDALFDNESLDNPDSFIGSVLTLFTTFWDKIGKPVLDAAKKWFSDYLVPNLQKIGIGTLVLGGGAALIAGIAGAIKGAMAPGNEKEEQAKALKAIAKLSVKDVLLASRNLAIMAAVLLPVLGLAAYAFAKLIIPAYEGLSIKAMAGAAIMTAILGYVVVGVGQAAALMAKQNVKSIAKATETVVVAGLLVVTLGLLGVMVANAYADTKIEDVGAAAAMTATISGLTLALALMAKVISKTGNVAELAQGAAIVAGMGLLVTVLGSLGAVISFAFEDIKEQGVNNAMKMIGTIVGATMILALSSLGLGAIITGSGGAALLPLAAGLGVLALVGIALASATMAWVEKFKPLNESDISKAKIAAEAAIILVDASAKAFSIALAAGLVSFFSMLIPKADPIEKGLDAMERVMISMGMHLPSMIGGIIQAVASFDPSTVELAVKTLKDIMEAIKPMTEVQTMAMSIIKDAGKSGKIDLAELKEIFENMSKFAEGPLPALTIFMSSISKVADELSVSDDKIKALKAFGPLFSSVGNVISAIMGPVSELIKSATSGVNRLQETHWYGNDVKAIQEFDEIKFSLAMTALGAALPSIMGSISPMVKQLVAAVRGVDFSEDEIKKITTNMKVLSPAAKSISDVVQVLSSTMDILKKAGLDVTGSDFIKTADSLWRFTTLMLGGGVTQGKTAEEVLRTGSFSTTTVQVQGLLPTLLTIVTAFINGIIAMPTPGIEGADAERKVTVASKTIGVAMNLVKLVKEVTDGIKIGDISDKKGLDASKIAMIGQAIMDVTFYLNTGMSRIFEGIQSMVKSLPDNEKDLKSFEGKLRIVKDVIESVNPVVSMVTSILEFVKKTLPDTNKITGDKGAAKEAAKQMPSAAEVVKDIGTYIDTIFDKLMGGDKGKGAIDKLFSIVTDKERGFFSIIGDDKQRKALVKNVAAMKPVFELISTIIGVIKEVGSTFKGEGSGMSSFGNMDMTGMIDSLTGVLDSENMQKLLPAIRSFVESYNKQNIPKIKNPDAIKGLSELIGNISGAAREFFSDNSTVSNMYAMAAGLLSMQSAGVMGQFKTIAINLSGLPSVKAGSITSTLDFLNGFSTIKAPNNLEAIEATAEKVPAIVASLAKAHENLGLLKGQQPSKVLAILDSLNKIKTGEVSVKHTYPNATIVVEVTLDSKSLAKSVAKADISANSKTHKYLATTDTMDKTI